MRLRAARARVAVDPLVPVSLALVLAILALVFAVRYYHDRTADLKRRAEEERRRASDAMQTLARWAPTMGPLDPAGFRFVGAPVLGVHFGADRITFVQMDDSPATAQARQQVMRGDVAWLDLRAPPPPPVEPSVYAPPGADDAAPPV